MGESITLRLGRRRALREGADSSISGAADGNRVSCGLDESIAGTGRSGIGALLKGKLADAEQRFRDSTRGVLKKFFRMRSTQQVRCFISRGLAKRPADLAPLTDWIAAHQARFEQFVHG